jgi:alpha-L-rhamnosidase
MTTVVEGLRAEHGTPALGIGVAAPRLSWRTATDVPGWWQAGYEVEVDGVAQGRVDHDDSLFVAWPVAPLRSRQVVVVRVRVWGSDGGGSEWSDPLVVEAGLLDPTDWSAEWITPAGRAPATGPAPVPFLRRAFAIGGGMADVARARLHVTSAGVHRVEINGVVVGDHVLAPGWTSYPHRLRYDTHDVTGMLRDGENVIGAVVADGWWAGRLGWDGARALYGDRLGLLAQLELTRTDGSVEVVGTDDRWRWSPGPVLAADLYDGEVHDARLALDGWSSPGFDDGAWSGVDRFSPTVGALVAPTGPPVRRTELVPVVEVLTTPAGRTVLDLGQNLVGRMRFTVDGPRGTTVTLRHAEVLEHGEPAYRPLRTAEATDRYTLRGGGPETWEPEFTFHGFRYVEVEGWPGALDPDAFTAVVLHSDMERTGTFTCDHELLDRFHRNVVWGMRGNFLDVPTDCPQRDERFGWTGDLQVFAPTAAFLYDVGGMLEGWLADLAAEQRRDGSVPVIVPMVAGLLLPPLAAGWSDAVTVVPSVLHRHLGDLGVLADRYAAMRAWVDHLAGRMGDRRLWRGDFQFGDWLDPSAPPELPFKGMTAPEVVATAYAARSARIVADVAALLGHDDDATHYGGLADEVGAAFRDEYLTPNGRLMSDSTTAYALTLRFGLVEDQERRSQLARHLARTCRDSFFTISTGFLGTPEVLPALTDVGRTDVAYRLMTQTGCPSWLYSVTMGATTVWERWDSLMPDGTVNPGGMTSFNHYAFGAAAQWLHETVGGLAPASPGHRRLRIAPEPGPGVTTAEATLRTPYGRASCRWRVEGSVVSLVVEVPPNSTATVVRPGLADELEVASGSHHWRYEVDDAVASRWAPVHDRLEAVT